MSKIMKIASPAAGLNIKASFKGRENTADSQNLEEEKTKKTFFYSAAAAIGLAAVAGYMLLRGRGDKAVSAVQNSSGLNKAGNGVLQQSKTETILDGFKGTSLNNDNKRQLLGKDGKPFTGIVQTKNVKGGKEHAVSIKYQDGLIQESSIDGAPFKAYHYCKTDDGTESLSIEHFDETGKELKNISSYLFYPSGRVNRLTCPAEIELDGAKINGYKTLLFDEKGSIINEICYDDNYVCVSEKSISRAGILETIEKDYVSDGSNKIRIISSPSTFSLDLSMPDGKESTLDIFSDKIKISSGNRCAAITLDENGFRIYPEIDGKEPIPPRELYETAQNLRIAFVKAADALNTNGKLPDEVKTKAVSIFDSLNAAEDYAFKALNLDEKVQILRKDPLIEITEESIETARKLNSEFLSDINYNGLLNLLWHPDEQRIIDTLNGLAAKSETMEALKQGGFIGEIAEILSKTPKPSQYCTIKSLKTDYEKMFERILNIDAAFTPDEIRSLDAKVHNGFLNWLENGSENILQ